MLIDIVFNGLHERMTVDDLIAKIFSTHAKKNSLLIDFTTKVDIKQQCELFIQTCLLLKLLHCHKEYKLLYDCCSINIVDNADCMYARQ